MEGNQTLIHWFDSNDGEILKIQQIDIRNNEVLDEVVMEREIAIDMCIDILKILWSNHSILPPTK